jgi:GT2 family glycosyltransferase
MRASVVVPTRRRPRLLARCLTALGAQVFDPRGYEVIVVNDGGDPATRDVVDAWVQERGVNGGGPAARYLRLCPARGPAAARNAGWREAAGEVVAFTDDDCIPTRTWLAAGVEALAGGAAGAAGRVIVPLRDAPTDYERDAARMNGDAWMTASCFYRREALEAVGGFDERFTMAWREDSDLRFSLLERGRRLVRAPDAAVIHPVRPAPWGVSVRQQRKAAFNALLYRKHPALYRRHIQRRPPWDYYATATALGVCAGASAARRWRIALAGAALWAVLTGRLCARRLRGTSHSPRHVAEMIVTSAAIPPLAVWWRLAGAVRYRALFL